MGTFTNRDSIIEIAKYVPKTNSFVRNGTIDRTLLGRKDTSLTAEGFTLVNLLGSYGGFEKDSNGDGLADNLDWVATAGTASLVNGISGKAQKLTFNGPIQSPYLGANIYYVNVDNPYWYRYNHKLFIRSYLKVENDQSATLNTPYGYIGITSKASYLSGFTYPFATNGFSQLNTWDLCYFTHTQDYVPKNMWIYFKLGNVNLADGETASIYADNFAVYDLTWMDQYSPMPQSLQEKYSVSKWVDMTDDDLANELPYVDGVAYVGVGL